MQKYANFLGIALISLLIGLFAGRASAPMTTSPTIGQSNMHGVMESMSSGLAGKTGDAFDKAFLDEMVVHHEGAVVMAQQVLQTSQRQELRKLADDIIAAQTKEIGMMRGWKSEWFGE